MSDIYFTIEKEGSGVYKEKMSRFLSFALPVSDVDKAKEIVKSYQNKYHDARHVCWAYMIGSDRETWQLNDNGEPSGTAGKPILGQINSLELTDVIVLVVRYFGGIKLGTSGLISAYREAARLALEDAGKIEKHKMCRISITFPYVSSNAVMKILKSADVNVLDRSFDNSCSICIEVRENFYEMIRSKLLNVDGVSENDNKI